LVDAVVEFRRRATSLGSFGKFLLELAFEEVEVDADDPQPERYSPASLVSRASGSTD
jgi:hypothetical protein